MPIDRLGLQSQRDQELKQLLLNQQAAVPGQIAQTGASVGANTDSFLRRTAGEYGTGASSMAARSSLGRSLSSTLANQQLTQGQGKIQAIYSEALRRANNSYSNRADAENYARSVAQQATQNEFQASEANKDRGSRLAQQDMTEQYQNRGMQQQANFNDQQQGDIYQQALYRSLFGLVGAGGTAAALNHYQGAYSPPQALQPINRSTTKTFAGVS